MNGDVGDEMDVTPASKTALHSRTPRLIAMPSVTDEALARQCRSLHRGLSDLVLRKAVIRCQVFVAGPILGVRRPFCAESRSLIGFRAYQHSLAESRRA